MPLNQPTTLKPGLTARPRNHSFLQSGLFIILVEIMQNNDFKKQTSYTVQII